MELDEAFVGRIFPVGFHSSFFSMDNLIEIIEAGFIPYSKLM
ncbi:hypothetical protein GRFL_3475 [Christiangramia flava JLT2011]|uniref:Uncharacterized protein n=1 Tax=Christiangramia flava JLT2011 TaxID=1229726 RepID=A0A1L7I9D9_9FLAO|nr:hypothetical protein GRFL_3475 [Christiangramia flava JLT2011]